VILVDANLLIYARVNSFKEHARARAWLDGQLSGTTRVGLPWPSLLAFLRLVTNPRVFARPDSAEGAWKQLRAWLGADVVWIPQPTDRHADILETLLASSDLRGNLIPDAHLAALAIEHGLALCSTDGDFARFDGLQWTNPLAA
jgi:uncharacterized protein